MKNFSPYTDLALEVAESLTNNTDNDLEGLKIFTEDCEMKKTSVTSVEITSPIGEEKMGRPMGTYITLESVFIKENNPEAHEKLIAILSKHLNQLCPLNNEKPILVVGLGNSQVTPDSLGPKTVDKILVTRHLKENLPDSISDTVRSVAALSPGVMGVTGIGYKRHCRKNTATTCNCHRCFSCQKSKPYKHNYSDLRHRCCPWWWRWKQKK